MARKTKIGRVKAAGTQEKFATLCGVTQATMSRVLNCKRHMIYENAEVAAKLTGTHYCIWMRTGDASPAARQNGFMIFKEKMNGGN